MDGRLETLGRIAAEVEGLKTIAGLRRLYAKVAENRRWLLTTPCGDEVQLTFTVAAGHPQLEVVGATVRKVQRVSA